MRPRLVATDLDGTLLRSDGTLSDRTRAVLQRLTTVGVDLVFVTARPPRWVDHLAEVVGGHGLAICANGAFVYDVAQRLVLRSYELSAETVRAVVADLRGLPDVGFAAEHSDGVHIEAGYPDLHPESRPAGLVDAPIEELNRPAGKLLARSLLMDEVEFLQRVKDIVGDRATVTHSGSGGLAEIGPPGVSKASALRDWCSEREIGHDEVWAFGDMPNDVPMLEWAGTSFAVANAHRDVLAAARFCCASNDEDGVAAVLEQLVFDAG